jgi:hypothetical protein
MHRDPFKFTGFIGLEGVYGFHSDTCSDSSARDLRVLMLRISDDSGSMIDSSSSSCSPSASVIRVGVQQPEPEESPPDGKASERV